MKKSIFQKWWFWVIAIVIFIGIVGNTGKDDTTTNDQQTASSNIEITKSPTNTPIPTPEPTPTLTPRTRKSNT
jgi:hypothetical protein